MSPPATHVKVFFTPIDAADAWGRCDAVASALGLKAEARVPGVRLRFDLSCPRPRHYTWLLVLGFIFYILPGIYLLHRYRARFLEVKFLPCPGGSVVTGHAESSEDLALLEALAAALPDKGMTLRIVEGGLALKVTPEAVG